MAPDDTHVADRRRRPHRPPLHARRQGAADARHPRHAEALHERRAVPSLHAHRAVAAGRSLRLRRLRQRARPQVSRRTARCSRSWGEPGTDPGQFNIPHNICCDADGWVYVADRENHRVQVFDGNGRFETQWNNMHRPSGLYLERGGAGPLLRRRDRRRHGRQLRHAQHRPARQHLQPQGRAAGAAGPPAGRARARPVHLAARPRRRFARRHLRRRGVVHQLGPLAGQPSRPGCAACRSSSGCAKTLRPTGSRSSSTGACAPSTEGGLSPLSAAVAWPPPLRRDRGRRLRGGPRLRAREVQRAVAEHGDLRRHAGGRQHHRDALGGDVEALLDLLGDVRLELRHAVLEGRTGDGRGRHTHRIDERHQHVPPTRGSPHWPGSSRARSPDARRRRSG